MATSHLLSTLVFVCAAARGLCCRPVSGVRLARELGAGVFDLAVLFSPCSTSASFFLSRLRRRVDVVLAGRLAAVADRAVVGRRRDIPVREFRRQFLCSIAIHLLLHEERKAFCSLPVDGLEHLALDSRVVTQAERDRAGADAE